MADDAPEQPAEQDADTTEVQPDGTTVEEVASDPDESEEAGDQELSEADTEEARANEVAFDWQASEYVQHNKGAGWYAMLIAIVVVLIALAVLLQYWLVIGAFLAMGGAIVVYAKRAPRTLTYELTREGITIEGKKYMFGEFRSFGVLSDEEWHTIDLVPTKRFSPRLAILFDDNDFDSIVDHLELHLPRVDRDPDVVERLTRMVRF